MYNKDGDLKNWFDLLNGSYRKLDGKEKNDDYYYIDKYINPLKKRGGSGGDFSGGSGILKNIYTSVFQSDNDIIMDDTADDGVMALESHEYQKGNAEGDNNHNHMLIC